MSLYKANRGESSQELPPPPPAASVRKGTIFRGTGVAQPKPEEEGFEELDGPPKAGVQTRILNHRAPVTQSTLPPITSVIRIPNGSPESAPEPSSGGEPIQAAASAPVVYQQVPVDQAIIEEAQQKAQAMMAEAQAAAEQMIQQYQQQAQAMMEQANMQIQQAAEQVQRQAQEIGFQQGYEQGLQQGGLHAQQQVYQFLVQSRDIFIDAIKQRHLMLTSAEPDLSRLAVRIAEKLVGQELTLNPETISGIVRVALAGIGDREHVNIRVNPADYEQVVSQRSTFEKMIEGLKKFEVTADAAIDPGGCAIETNLGNIDARLNTRVAALTAGLEEEAQLHEKEIQEEVAALRPEAPELPPPPEPMPEPQMETQMEMQPAPVMEE